MAIMLLLDVGNSACKWRLVDSASRRMGRVLHLDGWEAMCAELPQCQPDRIVVASVAGAEANLALSACLSIAYGVVPEFFYSPQQDAGVVNAYVEPSSLGVDRWLGVVEAFSLGGAAIVIDCGSAITVDAVSAGGQHMGGYIVPGLSMMHQSLKRETRDVRLSGVSQLGLAAGASTDAAVGHGIMRMALAFINDAITSLSKQLDENCLIIVTGGDAEVLVPQLERAVELYPDLVLDGLERVSVNAGVS